METIHEFVKFMETPEFAIGLLLFVIAGLSMYGGWD